jgi:hypothetical protein
MKVKSIIALSLAMLFTTACTDLDENLYDKVEAGNYGKSAGEIETIVGRAYASLRGFSDASSGGTHAYPASEYVYFLTALTSDEAALPTRVGGDWYDGGQYLDLQYHTWTPDNKVIWSAWKYNYAGISSVNAVMYQVDQSGLTDDEKSKIFAELRAVRAYYYYNLLDLFGNVPIITDYNVTDLPANSTREQVYNFIESELLDIINLLPVTGYGRMTQNAGNMLLARLYLNSEVFIGEARWQDCINVTDKIDGVLETDYFANFQTNNEVSREIIFAIPYDHKAGTVGNYMHSMTFHYEQKWAFSPTGSYQWCGNGMTAKPGIYRMFDENDIRRKSVLIGDQINLSTGSVIIMPASGEPLTYTDTITDITNAKQNEGGRLFKYEVRADDAWERDHDLVIMRYAEVLLMKAECYVRTGSPAAARPLVELVRSRAGLSTPDDITLEFLNSELKKEFLFESHRRTDNIRFGTFFEPWWNKSTTPSYRSIFPIPSYELQKNTNLKQNSGY